MVDDPLRFNDVTVQVNDCVAPVLMFGAPVLGVTTCVAVAVQPFTGSVTVTVYVPTTLVVGVADEDVNPPGPLQLNVAPETVDVALRLADGETHVSASVVPVDAPGGVVLLLMVCCAVAVQPFTGSVTVTVYVPATVTEGFCVASVNPPGPAQLYVTPATVEEPLRFNVVTAHVKS